MLGERAALARAAAEGIRSGFETYQRERARITARARARFEARDWAGAQRDARERLELRDPIVHACVGFVRAELGGAAKERAVWRRMKEEYRTLVEARPDLEIAGSFFNSVGRRVLTTVGVDPAVEFLAADAPPPRELIPQHRTFPRAVTTEALLRNVLAAYAFSVPFEDLARDARLAALELDAHLRELDDRQPVDAVELARPVFYRGKGAYVVGRLRRGRYQTPLVLALVNGAEGVTLDAILLTEEDVSIVFSFTRSYFHVEVERPRAMVAFLASILPLKRRSELYTALGFNRHGKAELYQEVVRHLETTRERFVAARGDRGLVMTVFTLPGLDVVFKVIKDRFPPPKETTRREVMDRYRHVFRHDRAGRLVDAQWYADLAFPARRFSDELLAELSRDCAETVRVVNGAVAIRHLYAERRVTPLNLFIREADEWTARRAVLDFGQALRDLAATDTFPGDLLLKNFGVTRHGRVIFYDYDELTRVTACRFRDLPGRGGPGGDDDGYDGGEPTFYVGPEDVFPEEFLPFLGVSGRLREVFLQAHGDLLTGRWWREIQERIRAGEIVDIFPYREEQRLRHARG
ncbi:bifunctional isocitrate dehydrogenase kinase/phosphatase [Anaeromyxobacter oryzisoli]|uniref:bifunctional isocitrate dehydrogenase kinase/phosphatase n=1 Tax=Anaeromyxobacter oryzisoli TaxID=2925408 RepID=UPI001F599828|nr:bifunctional isocitrate dehydrogenase kinase/phosphatase [Anaeromyxobacter sp. SG63]